MATLPRRAHKNTKCHMHKRDRTQRMVNIAKMIPIPLYLVNFFISRHPTPLIPLCKEFLSAFSTAQPTAQSLCENTLRFLRIAIARSSDPYDPSSQLAIDFTPTPLDQEIGQWAISQYAIYEALTNNKNDKKLPASNCKPPPNATNPNNQTATTVTPNKPPHSIHPTNAKPATSHHPCPKLPRNAQPVPTKFQRTGNHNEQHIPTKSDAASTTDAAKPSLPSTAANLQKQPHKPSITTAALHTRTTIRTTEQSAKQHHPDGRSMFCTNDINSDHHILARRESPSTKSAHNA